MTVDNIKVQEPTGPEKKQLTVQNEIQKDVIKETFQGDVQKQLLQTLASAQPSQQVQKVAQNQISKGYLNIKI
ncbi:MAG: hypothetical protein HW421_3687 [Ignavibacteria bacterium]|nr:hypothetical protein [Ignavibacteria bacterium]